MERTTRKISVTLPVETVQHLGAVAGIFGISRSALLAQLISEPLSLMLDVLADEFELASEEGSTPTQRLRGTSIEKIESMVRQTMTELEEIDRACKL